MATKIVTKNSSTAGAAPTATDLVQGELAVNVADGRLYTEDNAAAIVELGVNPATEITANAGIALPDSQKATFGDGGDLELFYNGTHSVFKDGSAGNIYIQDDNNIVLGSIGGENYLVATKDAAVTLYYDAAAKLATTATGIDVTGNMIADGVGIGTSSPARALSTKSSSVTVGSFESTSVSGGLVSFSDANTTNDVTVRAGALGNNLVLQAGGTERMRIDSSGNVGIGATASGVKLEVLATVSDNLVARFENNHATGSYGISVKAGDDSGNYAADFANKSGTSLMRIRGDGNVGIGTSSPAHALVVSDIYAPTLEINNSDVTIFTGETIGEIRFTGDDGGVSTVGASISAIALQNWAAGNQPSHLLFKTNSGAANTERMRIDSSGNLLVGTTDNTLYNNTSGSGIMLAASGRIDVARVQDVCAILNRTGASDGSIMDLKKNGTTVGSIGTSASSMYIGGSGNGALYFNGVADFRPWNKATQANLDNSIDLGTSSARFKDIYLSGGVYLGGTGAANKLDDYEEGTWTPVTKSGSTTVTTTVSYANYVKIGALVYVSAFVTRNDGASLSSNIQIAGLPFQVAASSVQVNGSIWFDNTAPDEVATNYFVGGTSYFQGKKVGASSTYVTTDQFQNGRPYYMNGVYNVAI